MYDTYVLFFHKHPKEILWEVLIYTFNQALASVVYRLARELQCIWRESEVSTQMLSIFEKLSWVSEKSLYTFLRIATPSFRL